MKLPKKPSILIANGVNFLGRALSRALLDQGAEVSVLGNADDQAKEFIKEFGTDNLKYFDFSVVGEISSRLEKLDYVIVILNDLPEGTYSTTDFVKAISNISEILAATAVKKSKLVLVTSMRWEAVLSKGQPKSSSGYSKEEIEQFAEKTVNEHVSRAGIDARIVRLGQVYGKGMDVNKPSILSEIIKQAVSKEEVVVPGETLQFDYYIHILDAVYGVLKTLFSKGTKGKLYVLANPQEISLLTLAHKVIETGVTAKRVKFEVTDEDEPLYKNAYSLTPNLEELGWEPKISFERGLAQTVDYFREILGKGYAKVSQNDNEINFSEDLSVAVKMDEVVPIEISKEKERYEKIQKLKKSKERRESALRVKRIVSAFAWLITAGVLLFAHFRLVVPAVGVARSYIKMQRLVSLYVSAYNESDFEAMRDVREEADFTADMFELYSNKLGFVWDFIGIESQMDRVANLIYGTTEFMSAVEGANEPQAVISFRSAKMWLDNSYCLSLKENFCKPYDDIIELTYDFSE